MAEEEVVAPAAVIALAPSDHKRKLEDNPPLDLNMNSEPDAVENVKDDEGDGASDAKRPRLDEETDGLASENGHKAGKENEAEKENGGEQPTVDNVHLEDAKCLSQEAPDVRNNNESAKVENVEEQSEVDASEQPATVESSEQAVEVGNEQTGMDQHETEDTQRQTAAENLPQLGNTDLYAEGEQNKPSLETSEKGDAFTVEQQPTSEAQTMSRKMDVPNNKVGVLIGKAGDTIRYLQYNSGAKIQITRDADADPYAATRPVELIGSFENINKAEKLIKDVIAEADAGGSPSLVARGFASAPAAGGGEQIQMQVPNEKVGLIIGKGGENIKSLQTKSGARIQLIPQHLPEGDQSKERTVRVSGDKKQIETAADMIKEVMNQTVRPSPLSSNYNQPTHRSRGPIAPSQWGPRGPHPGPPTGYDYQHRGPHPSQYPPPAYGSYPPQQAAPRGGGYGPGWEHRPSPVMQGPPQTGGYNYYGGPAGSHDVGAHSNSFPAHVPGRSPAAAVGAPSSQPNYNYGQQQGTDYGQPAPYSQTPPQQSYNQAPMPNHHPYGGHGSSYPNYPQTTAQPGYAASQQQYGRPPSYGAQSQGSHPQSYGPPRASQPGDAPYQGPYLSSQSYGQNVASQQPYPYASSGPMQQNYPPYGSVPAGDGYNQQPPASGPGYTQQAAQPVVSSYGQPVGQPGFPQGPQGGYGSYPSTQPVYGEQPAGAVPNTAGYGYQGPVDPSTAYGAPPSGQQGYAQPAPTQTTYDQSAPPSGGYVA